MWDLVATCAFGLEAVVRRELEALGFEASSPQTGRVVFRGDESAIVRANLWLRAADRVQVRLGRFAAADFDALFEGVRGLPWEEWIPAHGAFPVLARSVKSVLASPSALQSVAKKAIVERLLAAHRTRRLPEDGPVVTAEVALLEDVATVTIDTSGDGLHKRGYRDLTGQAPLRETMAAALVQLSFFRRGRVLLDPFCGSGTIAIEAAWIGRNVAPGLLRGFASEAWPVIAASTWESAREEARDAVLADLDERIQASDTDPTALSMARRHARRAGVEADIHFQRRPFEEISSAKKYGSIVTNPPYGLRLAGDDGHDGAREIERLYASMASVFERFPTWSFFVLTAYPEFERVLGRAADRRRKLYNAQIECTYYQFHGPRPPRAVSLPERIP